MKEQRITIEINPEGRITADAEGFAGDACLRDLDRLLEGLAAVAKVERKPDSTNIRASRTTTRRLGKKQ
ncbi:MAG: DUF2997 domain-containing protein [Nannocystaceae bacterium]